jgi:hypothetical protein
MTTTHPPVVPVASRDAEVRAVVAELDALIDRLAVNVDELSAILTTDRDQAEEAPA